MKQVKLFTPDPSPYVGTRIDEILAADERTRVWLSKRCGYSPAHLLRVIRGDREITAAFVEAVSRALKLPPDSIFIRGDVNAGTHACVSERIDDLVSV